MQLHYIALSSNDISLENSVELVKHKSCPLSPIYVLALTYGDQFNPWELTPVSVGSIENVGILDIPLASLMKERSESKSSAEVRK